MKLNAVCIVGKTEVGFKISCGEGIKSLKWLGLTAAAQYAARAPHGTRRHREAPTISGSSVSYIPTDIFTDECDFFDPNDLIADRFQDGDQVHIRLGRSMAVNEEGQPQYTRWATIAFAVSETQSSRREAAIAEQREIQARRERKILEEQRAIKAREHAEKAIRMRVVMASKLSDASQINASMTEDWSVMIQNGTFDKYVRSPSEQHTTRDVLKKHYFSLSEIFKTYAAAGSGMETAHELEYIEFGSFVYDIECFTTKHSPNVGRHVFEDSILHGDAKDGVMDRACFFNGLVRLSWLYYIDGGEGNSPLSRKVGKSASNGQNINPEMPIADAVDLFVREYLQPLIERKLSGAVVKHAMATDEVLAMFWDYHGRLREQFARYSSRAEDALPGDDNTMTISDFGCLIEESGLMSQASTGGSNLSQKGVRQAFSAAQGDEGGSAGGGGQGGYNSNQMQRMDFLEFLEAVARLGALKFEKVPSDEMQVARKIEVGLRAVCADLTAEAETEEKA